MRLKGYLTELSSIYGKGITFVDIDETLFKTFAKIKIIKGGKTIGDLSNAEFNDYKLKDGESFDFGEFANAELFKRTSIPIPQTINRIKRMFKNIDYRGSRVVLLTARADFDDKKTFLQAFRDAGLPIDKMYVERTGNMKTGTVEEKKEKVMMRYLSSGEYRRVRLIDDYMGNIKQFLKMEKKMPKKIMDKIKEKHKITSEESIPPLEFFGLLVMDSGSLKRITL